MIQFNLLPAVKMEYIRARRTKQKVLLAATVVIGACVFIMVVLSLAVYVWQALRLSSLDKSIKEAATELQSEQDIDKVLTVQNQLLTIDGLHESKPEVGRIFGYLAQVTPGTIEGIASFSVDFLEPTIAITGQSPSLEEVNKYIDTLKFTEIENDEGTKPFSQVVLTTFARDEKGVSFTITLNYDERIFSSAEQNIKLIVPRITTTRSETERPADLFRENVTPLEEGAN